MRTIVFVAEASTPHYTWHGIGSTEGEAAEALLTAWRAHAEQYGADPDYLTREDMNFMVGTFGQGFRDREATPHRLVTALDDMPQASQPKLPAWHRYVWHARRPLVWESAGTEEPGDQHATSRHIPALCTSAFWSLGPDSGDTWGVELIGIDNGTELDGVGVHLGHFPTEADAKAAAQAADDADDPTERPARPQAERAGAIHPTT